MDNPDQLIGIDVYPPTHGRMKKICKPVSRILSWAIIYLFCYLHSGINLPTHHPACSALGQALNGPFSSDDLHGISAP